MRSSTEILAPSEAALRLGVSVKALRIYEQRGLLTPIRSAAGWRAYGPDEMRQARDIASLRALGLSLAQVARVLRGDLQGLEPVLSAHQATLEGRIRDLVATVGKVRVMRDDLGRGRAPTVDDLTRLSAQPAGVAFDLPWPWGGERFELRALCPLTYITGPLGSGKTRLARCLAEALPGAAFLGLDRSSDAGDDAALKAGVALLVAGLVDDGATACDALTALLLGLEAQGPAALVIDMVEQGLNQGSQEALMAHLRRRPPGTRPLVLLTRSTAILDLDAVRAYEAIIFCPANHAPPFRVAPYPGSPGYEALASCLAPPDVRARTEGVIAIGPALPLAG